MEFVGKFVTKTFKGFGNFKGVIESYDSSTGFFKITYDDGDSEEIDFSEVSRLCSSSSSSSIVVENHQKVVATTSLKKKVGRKPKRRRRNNDPGKSCVNNDNNDSNLVVEPSRNDVVANEHVSNGKMDGFVRNDELDLNRGLSFDDVEGSGEGRGCIDLNLSVDDGGFDASDDVNVENGANFESKGKGKERGFDLNLGLNEEISDGNVCEIAKNVDDNASGGNVVDIRVCDGGSEAVTTPMNGGRRKRRKVEKNLTSPTETVLRRSARRAKAAALSESLASSGKVEDEVNDLPVSGVIDESEEKPKPQVLEMLVEVEAEVSPSKIELPPSSRNLNLEGIPVLDFFSVYACLRSFSTILYLSPFGLEDFVVALKSKVSNHLIDCIHFSILQTLRKQLELLASEGCESASTCLRNLNWDLLDVITWPVFMVEYLLIHGSELKPGFVINRLKLFDGEYYNQPAEVKIELLRGLCDDVIEVEAIRTELSKRTSKTSLEAPGDSCLNEGMKEEVADGNSDECRLCKMDGNLICCDGCPAAYHSKCVGIVSSLLPEGDWYCPECVISKPWKSTRGAELLGTDPFGRLYFSCFDFLLVSDSYDADALCCYYHKDDLGAVIELLRSSTILYGSIISAISQHWAVSTDLRLPKSDMESENCKLRDAANDGRNTKNCIIPRYSGNLSSDLSEPADLFGSDTAKPCMEAENVLTSSEGFGEVLQENGLIQKSHRPARRANGRSGSASKLRKKKGSPARKGRSPLKAKEEDVLPMHSETSYMNSYNFARTAFSVVEELLRKPSGKVNIDVPKSEEEIISIQLKFILKKSAKSCWTTAQDLDRERQKERCGWCYCCRFPVEGRGCLFSVKNGNSLPEALKVQMDGVLSKRIKKGHLIDVICYILCIEERLRGFLSGPWLRPQYSELWRQRVLKASDVSQLKLPLLTLESNLRPLALSADWWKHVDLVTTMGSASHFVASSRATSKNGISRKKVRYADSETKSSTAESGLVLFWWRGGKTSRSLFNWKVMPRSLALKVARKGGCMKIPDILYPEASEYARRTKCVTWRAAIETSTSLEQLALQVREFDQFIRWNDIENTHPQSLLDKESIKSIRLFKKVIVRRKCFVGTVARYLLDFGKRRSVPDVVLKHGQKFEESDSDKKKYWLDEAYVPLYLLKSFEERRITRKTGRKSSSKLQRGVKLKKKPLREKGFEYLFSRAERADSYLCGHCNKNVLIGEAVSCQLCNGFFHKRHVMKSSEVITTGCTYTCHRCRAGKHVKKESTVGKRKIRKSQGKKDVKVDSKGHSTTTRVKPKKKGKILTNRRKVLLRKSKKMQNHERALSQKSTSVPTGITLRRSARNLKGTTLHSNIFAVGIKRKRNKRNVASKGTPKEVSWQKKRTQVLHSFWINGLLFSRKSNDKRAVQFKRRKLLVSSDFSTRMDDQPKCSLCSQQGSTSALTYIACEICGDWFHGDAFGLDKRNVETLIGFKCHVCRERSPPVCPFVDISRDNSTRFIEASSDAWDAQGLPEVAVRKETGCVLELQCNNGSSGLLEIDEIPKLDSDIRVANRSPASNAVVSCSVDDSTLEASSVARDAQGLPEVAVPMETDCVLELQCNEGSSGLVEEVHTTWNCDGNLDQDETPMLDSELRVENRSSTSKEVVSCSKDNATLFVEASNEVRDAHVISEVAVRKEIGCELDLQCDEGSGLLEDHTVQKCDGNLDLDETKMLYSEVTLENGSSFSTEVVSCSVNDSPLFN